MAWTDERIATMAKLWMDGLSASEVARQLGGVSRNAVIGKLHRLGFSGRCAPANPQFARYTGQRLRTLTRAPRLPQPKKVASKPPRPQLPYHAPTRARRTTNEPYVEQLTPTATGMTLEQSMCRWPIGEPGEMDFGFCGRVVAASDRSHRYCETHHQASLPPPGDRRPTTATELMRSVRAYI